MRSNKPESSATSARSCSIFDAFSLRFASKISQFKGQFLLNFANAHLRMILAKYVNAICAKADKINSTTHGALARWVGPPLREGPSGKPDRSRCRRLISRSGLLKERRSGLPQERRSGLLHERRSGLPQESKPDLDLAIFGLKMVELDLFAQLLASLSSGHQV